MHFLVALFLHETFYPTKNQGINIFRSNVSTRPKEETTRKYRRSALKKKKTFPIFFVNITLKISGLISIKNSSMGIDGLLRSFVVIFSFTVVKFSEGFSELKRDEVDSWGLDIYECYQENCWMRCVSTILWCKSSKWTNGDPIPCTENSDCEAYTTHCTDESDCNTGKDDVFNKYIEEGSMRAEDDNIREKCEKVTIKSIFK